MPSVTLEISALVIMLVERDPQLGMVEVDRTVQILHFEEDLFETNEPRVMPPFVDACERFPRSGIARHFEF